MIDIRCSSFLPMTAIHEAERDFPLPKRRKLDSNRHEKLSGREGNPFHPFTLVPSPNEARPLETSSAALNTFAADAQCMFG